MVKRDINWAIDSYQREVKHLHFLFGMACIMFLLSKADILAGWFFFFMIGAYITMAWGVPPLPPWKI